MDGIGRSNSQSKVAEVISFEATIDHSRSDDGELPPRIKLIPTRVRITSVNESAVTEASNSRVKAVNFRRCSVQATNSFTGANSPPKNRTKMTKR